MLKTAESDPAWCLQGGVKFGTDAPVCRVVSAMLSACVLARWMHLWSRGRCAICFSAVSDPSQKQDKMKAPSRQTPWRRLAAALPWRQARPGWAVIGTSRSLPARRQELQMLGMQYAECASSKIPQVPLKPKFFLELPSLLSFNEIPFESPFKLR